MTNYTTALGSYGMTEIQGEAQNKIDLLNSCLADFNHKHAVFQIVFFVSLGLGVVSILVRLCC